MPSSSKLNVVLYAPLYDTGGQGWKIKRAFERYYSDEFSVRSIHMMDSYFKYPYDLRYRPTEAYPIFAAADVVHMRNGLESLDRLLGERRADLPMPGLVVQHHGTRFREHHARLAAEVRAVGAVQLASTLDLTLLEPDVAWLPAPFNLEEMASYRPSERPDGPIRVAHAPTNRSVKSTARVIEAIANLHRAGYGVVFDLIERVSYEECLRRKGKADIFVDQLDLGIGNNSLEAFGMSIPVVAGVSNPAVREAMLAKWGYLPFYEANEDNLEERLAHLIRNYELRAQVGGDGFQYLVSWHHEEVVVRQLAEVYRTVAARPSGLAEGVA